MSTRTIRAVILVVALTVAGGTLAAADGKLMHCFAFTPIESASDADWQAFYKATEELPKKIPGVLRVWYGKLQRNLPIFGTAAEARKKLAAGEKSVMAEVNQRVRKHGVCMEMADESTLKAYAAHPAHKDWEAVYSKVREPGTTTFDIIGQ